MALPGPHVILFDVNGTLSDPAPLAGRFRAVGAPAHLAEAWLSALLRDGIAATAAGGYADFLALAHDEARTVLSGLPRPPADLDGAVDHVLAGFAALEPHADVPEGVLALHSAGFRLATLSNGPAAVAERLLGRAGLADRFEAMLSVESTRQWKPAPRAYLDAVEHLGVAPGEALMVAVHPWDVDGARRAGLHAAWLHRDGAEFPRVLTRPSLVADDLRTLADRLTEGLTRAG
ncbi:haloacid dehalogenase type II [Streptomyces sp. PTM05]|uniref:Haloacid dehalogenase type II n=1 Tax=Streptantibioticus parmotrematis TaxID=2873249 RepID=A0ABS7QJW2_9ACTN|nr:haloacid dehalogenase type II [Streptantibioticus parmotrematis]MBY8883453.1 haloacid dehalogenase type II [Streptantibioticus parmotrematis]